MLIRSAKVRDRHVPERCRSGALSANIYQIGAIHSKQNSASLTNG